jgi:hypothetical protein
MNRLFSGTDQHEPTPRNPLDLNYTLFSEVLPALREL